MQPLLNNFTSSNIAFQVSLRKNVLLKLELKTRIVLFILPTTIHLKDQLLTVSADKSKFQQWHMLNYAEPAPLGYLTVLTSKTT